MFQFRRFPTYAYFIQRRLTEYCSAGFPHSEISGSMLMCSSPKLIAACHVLHRLLMPRHSPCALISLTFCRTISGSTLNHELCRLHRSLSIWLIIVVTLLNSFRHSIYIPQHFCFIALCCLLIILSIYIVQFSRCVPSSLNSR